MDQQTPVAATGTPAAPTEASDSPHPPLSQQQPQPLSPPSAPQPPNPNPNNQPPSSRPMMAAANPGGRLHPQGFPRTTWQHPHFSPFSSSTSSSPAPSLPISTPSRFPPLWLPGEWPLSSPPLWCRIPLPSASSSTLAPSSAAGLRACPSPCPLSALPMYGFGLGFGDLEALLSNWGVFVQKRPGMQGMGMMGSMNSGPQIRLGMVANPHLSRPVQSGGDSPEKKEYSGSTDPRVYYHQNLRTRKSFSKIQGP